MQLSFMRGKIKVDTYGSQNTQFVVASQGENNNEFSVTSVWRGIAKIIQMALNFHKEYCFLLLYLAVQ